MVFTRTYASQPIFRILFILEYLKKHQPRHLSKELISHFTVRMILFKKPPNVYKSTHTADLSFKKTTTTKNIDVSAC